MPYFAFCTWATVQVVGLDKALLQLNPTRRRNFVPRHERRISSDSDDDGFAAWLRKAYRQHSKPFLPPSVNASTAPRRSCHGSLLAHTASTVGAVWGYPFGPS